VLDGCSRPPAAAAEAPPRARSPVCARSPVYAKDEIEPLEVQAAAANIGTESVATEREFSTTGKDGRRSRNASSTYVGRRAATCSLTRSPSRSTYRHSFRDVITSSSPSRSDSATL
jgi:hypothetical protein